MKTYLLASCILTIAAAAASIADEPTAAQAGEPLKVVLTFDDGSKEHATLAAPLLAEYGYQATFNIITDRIGVSTNSLTWGQVRELAKAGHEIASHTCTHRNLNTLIAEGKSDDARHEILDSVAAIESNTQIRVTHICLPFNAWTPDVDKLVKGLGFDIQEFRRPNIGGDDEMKRSAREQARAAVKKALDDKRVRLALMFHGIDKIGWRPFPNGAADLRSIFEELRELERSGVIKVVPYAEAYP
ncbi:MAG: polysaccharide deacetylase family protein [Kiritimatiellae bacterium]|nr:polysaccharide deacetylase family protein [Kiritimatiellia bacterium]